MDAKELFEKINILIDSGKYDEASKQLYDIIKSDNPKTIISHAYYLIGYINTCWDNKSKSTEDAINYFLKNINSSFPCVDAYVSFAKLEEDSNVVEGYLKKGLNEFPNNPKLLSSLLNVTNDKDYVVSLISSSGSTDQELLVNTLQILIKNKEWNKCNRFIFRLRSTELSERQNNYLDIVEGFSLLFRKEHNYIKAIDVLNKAAENDISNHFGYAHYLGIIFANLKLGRFDVAKSYFDKLPITNSIFDYFEPWHFIEIEFDEEYKTIFDCINEFFVGDNNRLIKAQVLYALYLYYPSASYSIYRYNKNSIKILKKYFDKNYSKVIATALCNMYCHYKLFREANKICLLAISNYDEIEYVEDLYENLEYEVLLDMAEDIQSFLSSEPYVKKNLFISAVLESIVKQLVDNQAFQVLVQILNFFSINELSNSNSAFYYAYAYAELNNERGFKLYNLILEKEPDNASVLNNIAVIYENKNELETALSYFEKAKNLSSKVLYKNNFERVLDKINNLEKQKVNNRKKEIRSFVKDVNLEYFEKIGYNDELIFKINNIKDKEIKEIILRDLKECAIAISTKQNKLATIMIGSIIEAILFVKLKEKNISSYNISKGKSTNKVKTIDMALNDLLYVADCEKIIHTNNYHLSHYIRDYRNLVHPAKEIKSKIDISHENVLVMWSILKQLVNDVL